MYAGQAVRLDHVAQHVYRVVLNNTLIGQTTFRDQFAQAANTGGVHFHAKIVILRIGRGYRCRGFTHAKTDFQNLGSASAKYGIKIVRRGNVGHADFGHHPLVVTQLRARDATLTQHKAANVPVRIVRLTGRISRFYLLFVQNVLVQEPIRPVVGEDGSAE